MVLLRAVSQNSDLEGRVEAMGLLCVQVPTGHGQTTPFRLELLCVVVVVGGAVWRRVEACYHLLTRNPGSIAGETNKSRDRLKEEGLYQSALQETLEGDRRGEEERTAKWRFSLLQKMAE
jgi:hypothetical protein